MLKSWTRKAAVKSRKGHQLEVRKLVGFSGTLVIRTEQKRCIRDGDAVLPTVFDAYQDTLLDIRKCKQMNFGRGRLRHCFQT